MDVGNMNEIRTYYIVRVVTVMWLTIVTCVYSVPFINPLLWPCGIVKSSSNAQFRILEELVGHPGTFLRSGLILYHSKV